MIPDDGRWFTAIADHTGAAYLRYSFTKGTEQEVEFLVGALGLSPGMRVLDVGCGPGRHVRALAARGIDAVGVDVSETFLRLVGGGADYGTVGVALGDARCLPVRPGSFDAVISLCQGGFGLLGGEDDGRVLEEMAAAVKPGGRLALSAFSAYFAVRHLEEGETFDASRGVNHELAEVRDPTGRTATFDLWTTCFTPRELKLLSQRAGLSVLGLWAVRPGSYQPRPPDLEHPEWLLIASSCSGSTMRL